MVEIFVSVVDMRHCCYVVDAAVHEEYAFVASLNGEEMLLEIDRASRDVAFHPSRNLSFPLVPFSRRRTYSIWCLSSFVEKS